MSLSNLRNISFFLLFIITASYWVYRCNIFFQSFVSPQESLQKNVLMIIVDDLRPEIRAWGKENIITPNLDRLAEKGVSFHNTFAQYANCSPSRISLLTGLSPETTGHTGNLGSKPEFSKHVTLPGHFKENGYFTASIGKVYHDAKDDRDSWDYYFDLVGPDKPWTDPSNRWECYADSLNNHLFGFDRPAVEKTNQELEAYKDYILCKSTMSLIEKQKDKKFFITVGFRKPHLPFAAPEKYWDLYDRKNINLTEFPLSPDGSDSVVYKWSELASYNYYSSTYKTNNYKNQILNNDKALELRHGYFACVSFIDDLVGMLVNRLEKLNLDKNTIIVVMGDHGYQLGDQQVWGKHTNYNLSTRVPLIIFDPSMAPIKNNSEKYVELLDIFPTLSDLVSIPKPVDLDGKSFMTLFHNSDPEGFNSSFSQYCSFQKDTEFSNLMSYAIHKKNYTFIEWQDLEQDYKVVNRELYALIKGTVENKNISFDPEYSGKVEELSKELNQKFKQYRSKAKKYKNHYRN